MGEIHYTVPGQIVQAKNVAVNTSTETDLVTVTDVKHFQKSQYTVFYDVALGSATEVDFRYYHSIDAGSTWYLIPIKDTSTGVLNNTPTVINANGKFIEDLPVSASTAFKITGKSVGAAATVTTITVIARDN